MSGPDNLLRLVLDAHGGLSRWQEVRSLSAQVRFGGLAFASRFKFPGRRTYEVTVCTEEPRILFKDFPSHGDIGMLVGSDVAVYPADGKRWQSRSRADIAIQGARRAIWWDDLDLLYFAGYACWNYLVSPFVLATKAVTLSELPPVCAGSQQYRRLQATFDSSIPTHCPIQTFYFDEGNSMRRVDYDPLSFARWARAAHFCDDLRWFDGFLFPTRRRVVPRDWLGGAQPGPLLVWIEFDDIQTSAKAMF